MMPANAAKFRPFTDQVIDRYNLRLRPLDTKHFVKDVEAFLGIYNEALRNMWGFSPMSPREVRHMAEGLRYLMVPELAIAAEMGGRMVGAVFGLPDYNPRIKQIDGRLFPFGFVNLLRKKQEIKKIRILAATVLPEYSMMGIGLVLLRALVPKAQEWGLKEAGFSWVAESSHFSRGSLEKGGAHLAKTYRIYDWDSEADARVAAHCGTRQQHGPMCSS